MSKLLGIEPDSQLTPGALAKVVHAGAHAGSFRQAEADLLALAELPVSSQRVRRATQRIGHERVAQRDEQVERFLNLPLPEQQRSPTDQVPSLACVEMDGGRIQIRDRKAKPTTANAPTDSSRKGRFWRESKVGCLLSMESETHAEDPCPTIPEVFVDPRRVNEMSRELKGFSAESEPSDKTEEARDASRKRPEILVTTVVATREDIHVFGRQLAAAAWQRGFAGAARKAFVADALRYLTNQQTRMRHDAYRREGLPITSSHIESTIKQINRRVKGSEKFWNTSGAEALLQLSADYLSETAPLAPFWRSRSLTSRSQP